MVYSKNSGLRSESLMFVDRSWVADFDMEMDYDDDDRDPHSLEKSDRLADSDTMPRL